MKTIQHKFVEFIPDVIEEGVLYISMEYCIAIHKCVCGCGNEVVTPLSPTDWEIRFDGRTVSLDPSIGNWSFECKSHYFITRNKIRFARRWEAWEVEKGRKVVTKNKKSFFKNRKKKKKK
jgi:hypothetical protein